MKGQIIALVDCANFYVSVERAFAAGLAQRPAVVLSNNDGNIVAASSEAKALGLTRGMPAFRARPLIERHGVAVYSSNYALYQNVSDRVMRVLASFAEVRDGVLQQEIYSIDECFLSLAHVPPEKLLDAARQMQTEVLRATSIPVRIGIGPSKVLAKIAAEVAKRDPARGEVVNVLGASAQEMEEILASIRVQDVWGIGQRFATWLQLRGIWTAKALRDADPVRIRRGLHVVGQRIVYELRGVSCLPLEVAAKPKQGIMTARSFGRTLERQEELAEAVAFFTARAAEKLRRQGSVARRISVWVSTNRFDTEAAQYSASLSTRLAFPTNFTPDLMAAVTSILEQVFQPGYRYKRAGVYLSEISSQEVLQADLFGGYSFEHEAQKARLMAVIDLINSSLGRDTLFWGAQGIQQHWRREARWLSGHPTTRWHQLLLVT